MAKTLNKIRHIIRLEKARRNALKKARKFARSEMWADRDLWNGIAESLRIQIRNDRKLGAQHG